MIFHFFQLNVILKRNVTPSTEDGLVLRNEVNYAEHVKNIESGGSFNVVEECVFHQCKNFHVTKNLVVDVMHNIWEGIAQYDLAKILDTYVNVKKFFTLEHLNRRILPFPYQEWENKPVEIQLQHLKKKLKMSAAEMMSFIRNFTLLIGDLVPENDPCWKVFLSFKKALDVIMSPYCHANTHKILEVLIEEYLTCLKETFPQCMKPKHHHIVHYSRVFRLMAPLWHLSSMRFESRHRECKRISRSAICRANVCHTKAIKTQLQLNYRFIRKD